MRCSYLHNYNSNSTDSESESVDTSLLGDFEKHDWLVKKYNTLRKMSAKFKDMEKCANNKNMNSKPKIILPVVEIEDSPPESQDEEPNSDNKISNNDNKELSTSDLEIILFNTKINPLTETRDSKGPDKNYCEVPKSNNQTIQKSMSDDLSLFHDDKLKSKSSNSTKEIQNNDLNKSLFKTMTELKTTNSPNVMAKTDHTSIKHKLPLSPLPQREKYNIPQQKLRDMRPVSVQDNIPARQSSITLISHVAPIGTQTDIVSIVSSDEMDILDYIKNNRITFEQLRSLKTKAFYNAATNTDNIQIVNKQETQDTKEEELLKQAVACSDFNKIILKNHGGLCRIPYPNLAIPDRVDSVPDANGIKGENLQKIVDRLRPSLGEIQNNLVQRGAEEDTTVVKRRKVALAMMNNNHRNENHVVSEPVLVARRPQLRGQRKVPMSSQVMCQQEQYPHHTAMPEGPNYANANMPDNRMNITQYQFPRPQQPQVSAVAEKQLPPYYNTGPRMLHPFAMQYAREHVQYQTPRNEHWSYQQQYAERPPMMQQPMAADVVPTHAMNPGQQPMYRQGAPAHVSNYTNNDWLKNMPNNSM